MAGTVCHVFEWLLIAGEEGGGASAGACREELLRWACSASHEGAAFQGVLPGTAVLVIVRDLSFDPFPTLILKGANRNKLPLSPHSLRADSPQVWQLCGVGWVEAFSRLHPQLS